jgi:hypothetical protein
VRILRITGVRVNASTLPVSPTTAPPVITAQITTTPQQALPVTNAVRPLGIALAVQQTCDLAINDTGRTLPSAASLISVSVTTAPGCQWAMGADQSWIPESGWYRIGGGPFQTIPIGIPANLDAMPRTGLISILADNSTKSKVRFIQAGSNTPQDFTDVPVSNPSFTNIALLKAFKITNGCGTQLFCPDQLVTREQMASFIVRSVMRTEDFTYARTPYFTDVPATNQFFKYIQKLKELGITNGCAANLYCPTDPVPRWQMAVFLVKALATDTFPPKVGGVPTGFTAEPAFIDVASTDWYFAHVQKIKDEGVTNGCGGGRFCPNDLTTRAQMAGFIIRTFFTW